MWHCVWEKEGVDGGTSPVGIDAMEATHGSGGGGRQAMTMATANISNANKRRDRGGGRSLLPRPRPRHIGSNHRNVMMRARNVR